MGRHVFSCRFLLFSTTILNDIYQELIYFYAPGYIYVARIYTIKQVIEYSIRGTVYVV